MTDQLAEERRVTEERQLAQKRKMSEDQTALQPSAHNGHSSRPGSRRERRPRYRSTGRHESTGRRESRRHATSRHSTAWQQHGVGSKPKARTTTEEVCYWFRIVYSKNLSLMPIVGTCFHFILLVLFWIVLRLCCCLLRFATFHCVCN